MDDSFTPTNDTWLDSKRVTVPRLLRGIRLIILHTSNTDPSYPQNAPRKSILHLGASRRHAVRHLLGSHCRGSQRIQTYLLSTLDNIY